MSLGHFLGVEDLYRLSTFIFQGKFRNYFLDEGFISGGFDFPWGAFLGGEGFVEFSVFIFCEGDFRIFIIFPEERCFGILGGSNFGGGRNWKGKMCIKKSTFKYFQFL